MKKAYTPEEITFILENFDKLTLQQIADHIGRTKGSLASKLYEMRNVNGDFRMYYNNIMKNRAITPKETNKQIEEFLKDKVIPPPPKLPDWLEDKIRPKQ